MNNTRHLWAVVLATLMMFAAATASVATTQDRSALPRTNAGAKWRMAYYQGGPNDNYYRYLVATVNGLMELGWMDKRELPRFKNKDTRKLWQWLREYTRSETLEFVADAYYSAEWDDERRKQTRTAIIKRLNSRADIDLVIAMGTWAGKDLATDEHRTPTIVMSSSDPVRSRIIKSIEDSGFDHIFARVDPLRYERQVEVFHDIMKFKRLGVAYEDSEVGRSYAAIDTIKKVARRRGFEVVTCFTRSDIADQQRATQSVIDCFNELAPKVDAIYVTVQGGVNSRSIPKLVRLANEYRIPTFSQLGSSEVRKGFLLSISRAGGFHPVGQFLASTIGKIFNGAEPRALSQVFKDSPNIAINLKTAEIVGLYLYADILAAADELYRNIELP